MSRSYLFIAGLIGVGILIGYLFMPGPGQQQARVGEEAYLAPPAFSPSPAQAIDTESLATLQDELQQARQAREQLESRLEALQIRVGELEQARDTAAVIGSTTASRIPQAETAPLARARVPHASSAGAVSMCPVSSTLVGMTWHSSQEIWRCHVLAPRCA